MPGSFLPSTSSRLAPPPVETWVTRSERPKALMAAAESPPPTTVRAVGVAATRASAMVRVPEAKRGCSKTPTGPFQKTVLAPKMACR